MSSTFIGKPRLQGMESLVELRLQQFLLKGWKVDDPKFHLPKGYQQPLTVERYAALAAVVRRFLEPGSFGLDVKWIIQVRDSGGKISEVEVGALPLVKLAEIEPEFLLSLKKHIDYYYPLIPEKLGKISMRPASLQKDYIAGYYEVLLRDGPAFGPILMEEGQKHPYSVKTYTVQEDGIKTRKWSAQRHHNFEWKHSVHGLTAKEFLWVLLFNGWHGLVFRAALAGGKSVGSVHEVLTELKSKEGRELSSLLELYERSDGQGCELTAAVQNAADELIGQGADLVKALVKQDLISHKALLNQENVHDVMRRLRNFEKARKGNREKVGFALVSMRIVSQ